MLTAVTCTGENQVALELCKPAKEGQHQAALCSRGIGPYLDQRLEAGVRLADRIVGLSLSRAPSATTSRLASCSGPSSTHLLLRCMGQWGAACRE